MNQTKLNEVMSYMGSRKSARKTASCKRNALKGGRPLKCQHIFNIKGERSCLICSKCGKYLSQMTHKYQKKIRDGE